MQSMDEYSERDSDLWQIFPLPILNWLKKYFGTKENIQSGRRMKHGFSTKRWKWEVKEYYLRKSTDFCKHWKISCININFWN